MTMTTDLTILVLGAAERQTPNSGMHELDLSSVKVTKEDLDEALLCCLERGYIELWNGESPERFCGRKQWMVKRLTAAGHDKLRALRGQAPLYNVVRRSGLQRCGQALRRLWRAASALR